MKKIIFTGGHHNSTQLVLEWIQNNTDKDKIEFIWIGRKFIPNSKTIQTPEYKEISPIVNRFYDLDAGKLYRFRSIRYLPHFIISLLKIPIGIIKCILILENEKPNLIVSWGGYIAVPVVIASKIFGIKSVTHEQTITLGLANKIISHLVDKIYTAWPIENYPHYIQNKAEWTGLPIRKIKTNEKYSFNNDLPVLFVMGGKLGSSFINKTVIDNLDFITKRFNLIWACGSKAEKYTLEFIQNHINSKKIENIVVKDYFDSSEMQKVFNSISIAYSRSGAHSVYEFVSFNIPCLLTPIPWSSQNEQLKNAKIASNSGLGIIMEEKDYNPDRFQKNLEELITKLHNKKDAEFKNIENPEQLLGEKITGYLK